MIVMYKVAGLTYWLARLLVDVEAISIANLLAGKHIIPEYVQQEATADAILPKALALIEDSEERETMLSEFAKVRELLGGPGASDKAAGEILETVNKGSHG